MVLGGGAIWRNLEQWRARWSTQGDTIYHPVCEFLPWCFCSTSVLLMTMLMSVLPVFKHWEPNQHSLNPFSSPRIFTTRIQALSGWQRSPPWQHWNLGCWAQPLVGFCSEPRRQKGLHSTRGREIQELEGQRIFAPFSWDIQMLFRGIPGPPVLLAWSILLATSGLCLAVAVWDTS